MSKFILLYRGPSQLPADRTPAEIEAAMKPWIEWMGRVGSALADPGSPFGARTSVADDGTMPEPAELGGYSVVEAESLDAVHGLLDNHPFLTEGKGRFAVDVYELLPM